MKLTSVQLLILTPLPGSELYARLRPRGGSSPSTGICMIRIRGLSAAGFHSLRTPVAQGYGTPGCMPCRKAFENWSPADGCRQACRSMRGRSTGTAEGNQSYLHELVAIPVLSALPAMGLPPGVAVRGGWVDVSRRPTSHTEPRLRLAACPVRSFGEDSGYSPLSGNAASMRRQTSPT